MGEAEASLGYSSKSRTFSHRLRGLLLKALSLTGWDIDRAARLLAADSLELGPHLGRKLRQVIDSIAERIEEPDDRLCANLLFEHRRYALEARDRLRERRSDVPAR